MKTMPNKILVSGLLNIETTVAVRGFPINYYPIDYPFFGVNSNVAGVGFNVAKALNTLGDSVELVSFTGEDYEAGRIFNELNACGISTDRIEKTLKNTPTSVILFDPEGKRQVYCDLKDIQEQMLRPDSLKETLAGVDAAALCNINFNREFIKEAHRLGKLTATDVHVLGNIEDDYNRDFMENADILFLSDEVYSCIVLIKVILHCLDLVFDLSEISAFLGNYPALTEVLLTSCEIRLTSAAYSFHSCLDRNCVLYTALYTLNTADSV